MIFIIKDMEFLCCSEYFIGKVIKRQLAEYFIGAGEEDICNDR